MAYLSSSGGSHQTPASSLPLCTVWRQPNSELQPLASTLGVREVYCSYRGWVGRDLGALEVQCSWRDSVGR